MSNIIRVPTITIYDGPPPRFGEPSKGPSRIIDVDSIKPMGTGFVTVQDGRGAISLSDTYDVRCRLILDRESLVRLKQVAEGLLADLDEFFDKPRYIATEDRWRLPVRNSDGSVGYVDAEPPKQQSSGV